VKFLGKNTDVKDVPLRRWTQWESWRKQNNARKDTGTPTAITIQNEMGMIMELWRWGIEEGYIPFTPKLPFQGINLIPDDKVRRDTWEAHEWKSFARRLSNWLNTTASGDQDFVWDAFVSYQMLFFLANSGMRIGELVKVRNKDIQFRKPQIEHSFKKLNALVQVHPSTKTGAREVNAMGGEFAKRVYDHSKYKNKEDFLFCHLNGRPFTTKQFRTWFQRMIAFTDENARWGKEFVPYSLRHFYATTRLQNGTSTVALCNNMGVGEQYLKKHYSHYLTRLADADLMKMNNEIGVGAKVIPDGEDFFIPENM
jgi:integrase